MNGLIAMLTVVAYENMDNIHVLADAYLDLGMLDDASRVLSLDFRSDEYVEAMYVVYAGPLASRSMVSNVLRYKEGASTPDQRFVRFLIGLDPDLELLIDSDLYENKLGNIAREQLLRSDLVYFLYKSTILEKCLICKKFSDYKNCSAWRKLLSPEKVCRIREFVLSDDAWQ